jgi:hypothetical protein
MLRTESRDLPAFEAIACDGAYEIQVECQEKQALTIDTDENLLPLIKTEVSNNSLHIFTDGNLAPSKEIRILISLQNLSELTINGSAGGDIDKINNKALTLKVHGSSKLKFSGKTGQIKIDISGSSKIDAASLVSEDAKIQINGSGNIKVNASETIDAQINGSGTIKYKGEPKHINQEINGSGSIVKD